MVDNLIVALLVGATILYPIASGLVEREKRKRKAERDTLPADEDDR
jgi:hypothetical protein